jgi:hypothetical protein
MLAEAFPELPVLHRERQKLMLVPDLLRPEMMQDLTHELLSSDWFEKFQNWFQMPLLKVEELTDIFINCGYIQPVRLLMYRGEFCEWSELFIMSALYCLGTGNLFCTCQALCYISVLHLRNFFYTFLDVIVEMQDEFIDLPKNIMEWRRTLK